MVVVAAVFVAAVVIDVALYFRELSSHRNALVFQRATFQQVVLKIYSK